MLAMLGHATCVVLVALQHLEMSFNDIPIIIESRSIYLWAKVAEWQVWKRVAVVSSEDEQCDDRADREERLPALQFF
jgi:hypothetical protein